MWVCCCCLDMFSLELNNAVFMTTSGKNGSPGLIYFLDIIQMLWVTKYIIITEVYYKGTY